MKNKAKNNIFLITGDFHQGKTTFARETVKLLNQLDFKTGGFLSEGTFKNGKRDSFVLVDIETNQKIKLCSIQPKEGWQKYRKFYFNPAAIQMGNQILQKQQGNRIVLVDEVGPMEMEKKGWYSGMKTLCEKDEIIQIWVVRNILIDEIKRAFNIPGCNIIDIEKDTCKELFQRIKSKINS